MLVTLRPFFFTSTSQKKQEPWRFSSLAISSPSALRPHSYVLSPAQRLSARAGFNVPLSPARTAGAVRGFLSLSLGLAAADSGRLTRTGRGPLSQKKRQERSRKAGEEDGKAEKSPPERREAQKSSLRRKEAGRQHEARQSERPTVMLHGTPPRQKQRQKGRNAPPRSPQGSARGRRWRGF